MTEVLDSSTLTEEHLTSTPGPETEEVETTAGRDTEYVVLQEINSVEELATIIDSAEGDRTEVFAVIATTKAPDRKTAARRTANDLGINDVRMKAVAQSAWKTVRPRNVLQMFEEDD